MIRLIVFALLICGVAEGSSYSSSRPSSKSYSSSRPSSSSSARPSSFSSGGKSYSSGKSSSKPTASKSFDSSAASAQKAQQGKASYTSYKEARSPKVETPRYRSSEVEYKTRTNRQRVVFNNYYNTRPAVIYRDNSWNPLFWMWLMDHRDRQAEWVYHHRAELSEERYRDLLAQNVNLESQLKELENQKLARDPNYAPRDVDRDLMYANAEPEKSHTWVAVTVIVVASLVLIGGFYFMRI